MESGNKRKRQPNFSLKEKGDLFNIISTKYYKIIENKATDKVSINEKEDTWNLISDDFNSTSETGLYREKDCLKRLYENRKREIRKIMARNRQEIIKTGGGQAVKIELDAADEILLGVMNVKTVVGLHSPFDSDNALNNKVIEKKQEEFILQQENKYHYDKNEDIDQNVVIEYWCDNENLNNYEEMKSPLVVNEAQIRKHVNDEIMENENGDVSELTIVENKEESRPTFKKASDFQLSKNPALRVPYLKTSKVKQGEKEEAINARCRARGRGNRMNSVQQRRRTGIQILSSSHIAQKYDEILDQRKILLAKQIEIADQELSFQRAKNKLEIEILTKKNAREND